MWKKILLLALIVLLIVPASGCFGGGTPPTSREALASLDAAIVKYDSAMGPYTSDNFAAAREEFVAAVNEFKGCRSSFDSIAKSDATTQEKRLAGNLAGCSEQFAYASAYMRDACNEALKPGDNDAYLMQATAEEFEMTARNTYRANKEELERLLSSRP